MPFRATTNTKPLTLVEKFFATIARGLRKIFGQGRKEGLPSKSMAEWLNKHWDGYKPAPGVAPMLEAQSRASAVPAGTPLRRVLDQEVAATDKDERIAAVIGLTKPYERTLEQIISKKRLFTPPPSDPSARLAWWNNWVNTLDYISHKYPQLANYARVMTDRNEIAQALRKQFIEMLHPLAGLKTKKNVNAFAIFADALGYEGAVITKQGTGLVLKFDPKSLPVGSYLRQIAPANGTITLDKDETAAYNSMRNAYNAEHKEVRRSLLVRYGIPEGTTQNKLWDLAKKAEDAAKATENPAIRKEAQQRAPTSARRETT